jgi:A/G-specific adenine glycosylase
LCGECPLTVYCLGYAQKTIGILPVKLKKQSVRQRFFVFELIQPKQGWMFLQKRNEKDIWQHLYQFPLKEFSSSEEKEQYLSSVCSHFQSKEYRHVLSHQHLFCHFIVREATNQEDGELVQIEDLHQYPIPRAIDRFLDDYGLDIFPSQAR